MATSLEFQEEGRVEPKTWHVAGTFKLASTGRSITLEITPRNSVHSEKYSIPLAHIDTVRNGKRSNGCVYELIPENEVYQPDTEQEP